MIRDLRMMVTAMENRWPIKPEYKSLVIRKAVAVLLDAKATPRQLAAASRIILAAEAQNQQDEQHSDRVDESRNRILDVLARLNARASSGVIDAIGTNHVDGGDE